MIIKNNNKAVDVQKEQHVCWEGQKTSRRFYVKKTISYGKWSAHKEPETIPAVSWEGGTTANCKCWVERTNTIREGFHTWTETQYHYLIPSFTNLQNGIILNETGNNEDGWSITFPKRDVTSSDLELTAQYQYVDETGRYGGHVTVTQTKRDKYVTKLDNATITTEQIPASGGNISSGKLTFRKTYNTGETENVTENVTFPTVSATTKGTTESGVTDVKTIAAGGTTQKQTTIDGVTLTHPSFTVKQAANTKSVMTPESKKTTSVILSVSPTTVYSSGGTVTFTLQRRYTLNKVVYQYTSGSTSGGGSDANQGPETVNSNQTYTITGITGVSSTKGTSYKIPASTSARTIKFKTTYDGITSNEAIVTQKLDGPDASKPFTYSDLEITKYSYATDKSGYHFPASGKTITATDCTLEGTYKWTYTSMENKTVTETVKWTFNDLTANMYTFRPTSVTSQSLGTSYAQEEVHYAEIIVILQDLKHTYNGKQYDVKDSGGNYLKAYTAAILTRQGNRVENKELKTESIAVSVNPTSFTYTGGTATLTSKLVKIYNEDWTSKETSVSQPEYTDITSATAFTGVYKNSGETTSNKFSFTGNKPVIPNIQSSTKNRTYTFTGNYYYYSPATATLTQTGNTTLFTVTFHKNNTYAKWSKTTGNESITKKFSKDTPYTELKPDETPTWTEGSNLKYVFLGNYSTTTTGNAVTSGSLLTGDINLYARWSTASTGYVKVSWDPNGGQLSPTSGGTSTSNSIYDYHNPGAIKCQPSDIGYKNTPSKTGNTFLGWYYNSTYYKTFPVSITLSTTPIQFNAMYTVTQKTVYWNSNGGTFSDGSTQKSEKKNYGDSISAYSSSPSKTADTTTTYKFKGWALTTNGAVVTFPYTLTTTNTTFNFYAIYTSSANTYTVTWANTDASIAIWEDNKTTNKTSSVTHGTQYKALTAPAKFANPIKNSGDTIRYTAAWYTLPTNGVLLSTSTTQVTKDITVYAVLTISGYKVTLNPTSGSLNVSGKAYTTISPYITYTKGSFNLGSFVPTHTNQNFKGWSTNSSATTGSTSSVTINAAITYYAIWKQLFTVTWNLNGGNIGGATSNKTESVESGSTVSFTKYTPVKTNSVFQGWSDLSTAQTGSLSGSSPAIFANTTYYAIWSSYGTINLNPNGGTLTVSGTTYTSTYTFRYYQHSLDLSIDKYQMSRTGYTFVGWNEDKNATTGETRFTLGTSNPSTIWTGTKTYYAIWKSAVLTPILLVLA